VLISRFSGCDMNVDLEKVTIVPWSDVLAIVPKSAE
jgi:co-chaperonin GroES (HSP10)